MKKKPFIGRFTGFLYIGEEKAEFDGETLVSYYAKPYCTGSADVPNCIEFRNDKLVIRDVHSPDSEEFDCIWEQEDIESVLDKLGMVAAYRIETIACSTIKQLVIPLDCMGITDNAFEDCSSLEELIYFCDEYVMPYMPDVNVISAQDYLDEVDRSSGNYPVYHLGVCFLRDPENGKDFGRYISRDCIEVGSADVGGSKWIFFWGKNTVIQENVIDKDAVILGFIGSTAEQYAKTHGITFKMIDGTDYDASALPNGLTLKKGQLTAKGMAYLRINGLNKPDLEAMSIGEQLEIVHAPDELNERRVIFQNADTGEFRGLLAYRAAYTVSYLLERGYLKFKNVISEGNGYVSADVLWAEPVNAEMLRFLTLTKDCPQSFWDELSRESDSIQYISPAFIVSQMKRVEDHLTTDDLMILYEPGNRISSSSANRLRLRSEEGSGLSAFKYTDNNRYEIFRSPYSLTVDAKTKSLICKADGVQIELSTAEKTYAQIYINHYRQLYNLPPIRFDETGGEINGTV